MKNNLNSVMEQLLTKQIKGPPFIRLPVTDYIKCSRLMRANNEAVAVLKTCMSNNSSLWTEIDILKKAIYKMKMKWRLEPLFCGTKQVLKCMLILKSENILDTILSALDSVIGLDGKTLVPSKQYLQFLLVKIIGVGKLAVQTIDYCVYVQTKLLGKIEIGHVLSSVMSFSSLVSRIWVLSHTLLVQLRTCYQSIYSLHLLSTAAEYTWLPQEVTLPDKFPFDVDTIILRSSSQGTDKQADPSLTPKATRTQSKSALQTPPPATQNSEREDVGVVIHRSAFTKLLTPTQCAPPSCNQDKKKPSKKVKKRKLKPANSLVAAEDVRRPKQSEKKSGSKKKAKSLTAAEGHVGITLEPAEHMTEIPKKSKLAKKKRQVSSMDVTNEEIVPHKRLKESCGREGGKLRGKKIKKGDTNAVEIPGEKIQQDSKTISDEYSLSSAKKERLSKLTKISKKLSRKKSKNSKVWS